MADRLTEDDTRKLLDQVAPDMSNKEIARLAGGASAQSVTNWKRTGMPKAAAALLVHRLINRKQVEAARSVLDMQALLQQLQLD